MNITLFLGSGISIASGFPSVVNLTQSILETNTAEGRFLKALNDYDKKARSIGGTYVGKKRYIKVGEAFRNYTSYEDLYYLCSEIALFDYGLHSNAMVPAFMESLLEWISPLLKERSKRKRLLEVGRLGHSSKKFIDELVIEQLVTPSEIKGLDLIVQLANSPIITALNIVTLNHDTLVEELLFKNGIVFTDGFGSNDGDVRWFEPNHFFTDAKVKLIKLHGSIDWHTFSGGERVGKVSIRNSNDILDSNGKVLRLEYKYPKVLSGLNKINQYNIGIYTDIHYHFQRLLYESNLIVMSGYGWGDEAINNRLMTWLDKRRENRLVLLHENPDLLKQRSLIMLRDYSNWFEQGKLKPILKWLSNASMNEVLKACAE